MTLAGEAHLTPPPGQEPCSFWIARSLLLRAMQLPSKSCHYFEILRFVTSPPLVLPRDHPRSLTHSSAAASYRRRRLRAVLAWWQHVWRESTRTTARLAKMLGRRHAGALRAALDSWRGEVAARLARASRVVNHWRRASQRRGFAAWLAVCYGWKADCQLAFRFRSTVQTC